MLKWVRGIVTFGNWKRLLELQLQFDLVIKFKESEINFLFNWACDDIIIVMLCIPFYFLQNKIIINDCLPKFFIKKTLQFSAKFGKIVKIWKNLAKLIKICENLGKVRKFGRTEKIEKIWKIY